MRLRSGRLRDCLAALVRRLRLWLRLWVQPRWLMWLRRTAPAPAPAARSDLERALSELNTADTLFNEARDPVEIDRAIRRLNLARAGVDEHLRQAAQKAEEAE